MLSVAHNMLAYNANRQLGLNVRKKEKAAEKLSSGYRINRSADDAAGLAISEKMRRQIRGLTQASANAQDGISMVQIADGAMAEVHEMLNRATELSIKAANGTLTDTDRGYIETEIEELKKEIDGISDRTVFNEIQVLKGKDVPKPPPGTTVAITGGLPSFVTIDADTASKNYMATVYTTQEVCSTTNQTYSIDHSAAQIDFSQFAGTASQINDLIDSGFYTTCCTCDNHYSVKFTHGTTNSMTRSGSHYIYNIGIDGAANASDLIGRIIAGTNNGYPNSHYTKLAQDGNVLVVYDDRSMGADPTGLSNSKWSGWSNPMFNIKANSGRGKFGAGVATEYTEKNAQPEMIQLQVGSEAGQLLTIELPSISCKTLQIDGIDVRTQKTAGEAIETLKNATAYVSRERSRMGTYQNRLEHTIRNLDNVVENTTAAESLIRDTDMAHEMMVFSNSSILSQAGQAMLAQANQSNQGILALLQ